MKTKKIALVSIAFFLGIVSVISLFAVYSFTGMQEPQSSPGTVAPISAKEANLLLTNYLKTADTLHKPLKGFYLDRQQLEALNMLAGKNSALAGFRLYLGRDEHGMLVGMVVGVDEKNADLVSDGIYKTGTIKSGPCPDICDKESPISGND